MPSHRHRVRALVLLAFALIGAHGARVRAQSIDCGDSLGASVDLSVRPGDGAKGVALDAPIIARYAEHVDLDALQQSLPVVPGDPCQGQLICLFLYVPKAGGGAREPVSGSVQRVDDRTVSFVPDAPLEAHSKYFSQIARAGFDIASRTELELLTGNHVDREPPRLNAAKDSILVSVVDPPAQCHAPAGSLRVGVLAPRATDDGDEQSVEVSVFLTQAAGLSKPVLVARARNPASGRGELQTSFLLHAAQIEESVCVQLRATDGVGRSSKEQPEVCFNPLPGSFFASCSVSSAPGLERGRVAGGLVRSLVASWAIAAVVLGRRTRGRRTRRA